MNDHERQLILEKKQQILRIANERGWFAVSLRYRDTWINDICLELCKDRKLKKQRKIIKGQYIYNPRNETGVTTS